MRSRFGGLILIVIGALALAHNLGYLDMNLARLVRTWWPAALIAIGVVYLATGRR